MFQYVYIVYVCLLMRARLPLCVFTFYSLNDYAFSLSLSELTSPYDTVGDILRVGISFAVLRAQTTFFFFASEYHVHF